jgi:hypothetical protein
LAIETDPTLSLAQGCVLGRKTVGSLAPTVIEQVEAAADRGDRSTAAFA